MLDPAAERAIEAAAVGSLQDLIEEERGRLMIVESILHCVVLAMDGTDCDRTNDPYYQNVIGVARELLVESINRLDSVRIRPLLEPLAHKGGKCNVKDTAAEYLH